MAIISIPSSVKIINLEWTSPPTYQVNRSELTGKTRTVQLGPAGRWFARGQLVPVQLSDAASVRGFLASMKLPGNSVALQVTEGLQRATAPFSCTVSGAGQLGYSLVLAIGVPSATILRAGDVISVVLTADDYQPIVLAADLVTNGSGIATASLTEPLRRSPANGAGVNLADPRAIMRMRNPLQWSVVPGPIYSSPCDFEEAF